LSSAIMKWFLVRQLRTNNRTIKIKVVLFLMFAHALFRVLHI